MLEGAWGCVGGKSRRDSFNRPLYYYINYVAEPQEKIVLVERAQPRRLRRPRRRLVFCRIHHLKAVHPQEEYIQLA
jgi:hypothetical protein